MGSDPSFRARMAPAGMVEAGLSQKELENAQRRIQVVAEFARIKHASRPLAEAYAARLGLSIAQFYRLVRSYRERGEAFALKGPSQAPSIDPRAEAQISAVIGALGSDAPLAAVISETQARCGAQDIPLPSVRSIKGRLEQAREAAKGSALYPPLAIDRVPLELNIATAAGPVAAWLTMLIHTRQGEVLGYHLSPGDAGPLEAARAVLAAIGPDEGSGLPRGALDGAVTVFRDLRPEWGPFVSAWSDAGFLVVGPQRDRVRTGAVTLRLLGGKLGRFAFRPRLPAGQVARQGGAGVAPDLADAKVRQALRLRGALGGGAKRVADGRVGRLADSLRLMLGTRQT